MSSTSSAFNSFTRALMLASRLREQQNNTTRKAPPPLNFPKGPHCFCYAPVHSLDAQTSFLTKNHTRRCNTTSNTTFGSSQNCLFFCNLFRVGGESESFFFRKLRIILWEQNSVHLNGCLRRENIFQGNTTFPVTP